VIRCQRTVTRDRDTLNEFEAIGGFESRDLAEGELGQEFRLVVIGVVHICLGQSDFNTRELGHGFDLHDLVRIADLWSASLILTILPVHCCSVVQRVPTGAIFEM